MSNIAYCKYFRCLDSKNNPIGLVFVTDYGARLKNNEKYELKILQSCFGHLEAI